MIAVVADDLTGAAELAGIGHRFGMRTVLKMDEFFEEVSADLLVIATNTRSLTEKAAVAVMERVTRRLMTLNAEWVYKKTDSVLRGHVIAELAAQREILGLSTILLSPANPALGRTIEGGIYYYNGRPIHESAFNSDPDFPIRSSVVTEMLRTKIERFIIGGATEMSDLDHWAAAADEMTFCAGGAGFFEALLRLRAGPAVGGSVAAPFGKKLMVVSGTAFDPGWAYHKAIIRIGGGGMTELVNTVRQKLDDVDELLIEGGATAFAVLSALGLSGFIPEEELGPGVVRMKVLGGSSIFVTVKPGSYPWADRVRQLLEN